MGDQKRSLTEVERQIQKLEVLRLRMQEGEKDAPGRVETSGPRSRGDAAEDRVLERLSALKGDPRKAGKREVPARSRKAPAGASKKASTEAERQIQRLEGLRLKREDASEEFADRTLYPAKTAVEKTIERLSALKAGSRARAPKGGRVKVDGARKNVKLSHLQLRLLAQLWAQDPGLSGSRVVRIALNRFLGLDQAGGDTELETRIHELVRRLKGKP